MIVNFKDFSETEFIMEVDPNDTIYELKQLIQRKYNCGLHYDMQRLVLDEVEMDNRQKFSFYEYKPDQIVKLLMTNSFYQLRNVFETGPPIIQGSDIPSSDVVDGGQSTSSEPPSSIPSPVNDVEFVQSLKNRGFHHHQIVQALNMGDNDPDFARNVLFYSTIPSADNTIPPADPFAKPTPTKNPLDFLRDHPKFDYVKRLLQSNPEDMETWAIQLLKDQPMLWRCVAPNLLTFCNLFADQQEQTDSETETHSTASVENMESDGEPQPSTSSALMPPPKKLPRKSVVTSRNPLFIDPDDDAVMQIDELPLDEPQPSTSSSMPPPTTSPKQSVVTTNNPLFPAEDQPTVVEHTGGLQPPAQSEIEDTDLTAIRKIIAMGFTYLDVSTAYFACDKNLELTVNFLLEQDRKYT